MHDDEILSGSVIEDTWLALEQLAGACCVETEWLVRHVEEGLFPDAISAAGTWRFSSASLLRARRMRELERNFDAVPELAALVADLIEEIDELRARMRRAGLSEPQA